MKSLLKSIKGIEILTKEQLQTIKGGDFWVDNGDGTCTRFYQCGMSFCAGVTSRICPNNMDEDAPEN